MDSELSNSLFNALKWVGIVFAAGFVGYFGRHLSKLLIAKLGKNRSAPPPSPPVSIVAGATPELKRRKDQVKAEKINLKLEKKKDKASQKTRED